MASRATIISKVRAKIEELTDFTNDEVTSVDIVSERLDDAANSFRYRIPAHLIDPDDFSSETHVENSDGLTGYIHLPSDFLKLHSFKMDEWDRVIYQPISEASPRYMEQKNPYTMGTPNKPVCVLRWISAAQKALEYYSVVSDHTIALALYIKRLSAAENESDILIDPMTWFVAAEVLQIMQEFDAYKMAMSRVNEFITLNNY